MRRALVLAALIGGCAFDPSGIDPADDTGDAVDATTPADAEVTDAVDAAPADIDALPEPPKDCGPGWLEVDGQCYLPVLAPALTWNAARDACVNAGATLVIIDEQKENEAVRALVPNGPAWWIGAGDAASEGTFVWVGGQGELEFTAWDSGEPNDGGLFAEEDCVEQRANGKWNDNGCGDAKAFVCEKARP